MAASTMDGVKIPLQSAFLIRQANFKLFNFLLHYLYFWVKLNAAKKYDLVNSLLIFR